MLCRRPPRACHDRRVLFLILVALQLYDCSLGWFLSQRTEGFELGGMDGWAAVGTVVCLRDIDVFVFRGILKPCARWCHGVLFVPREGQHT